REWLKNELGNGLSHKLTVSSEKRLDNYEGKLKGTETGDAFKKKLSKKTDKKSEKKSENKPVVNIKEIDYLYKGAGKNVLNNLSLKVNRGCIFSVMGGNGSGKTTLLKLIAGIYKPLRGKLKVEGSAAYLPQNPKLLFTEITVEDELAESFTVYERGNRRLKDEEIKLRVEKMLSTLGLSDIRKNHPYDISGGQSERLAIGKLLLTEPDILLLDEPTKGLDAKAKDEFAELLLELKNEGKTIIIVSHDMEFVAKYSDYVSLLFDGEIIVSDEKRKFFIDNMFYTTNTRRICAGLVEDVILVEDMFSEKEI
nr:energy-coupling factor ABC transporter ATP-binding protein [Lachnospiraceae bacterium]